MTNKELKQLYDKRIKDKQQLKSKRAYALERRPKTFDELLSVVFKENPYAEQKILEQKIMMAWTEVVGEVVAKASRPLSLKKNTLIVHVTDSMWMQHLIFLKIEILKKYRKKFPKIYIRDLFFTQKGQPEPIVR